MSTLDCAGNSNGEIPTHLWNHVKKFPQMQNETHKEWIERLERKYTVSWLGLDKPSSLETFMPEIKVD
jgi:hypothetical protein